MIQGDVSAQLICDFRWCLQIVFNGYVESAPAFGLLIRARRQARATDKRVQCGHPYTGPCRRVRLKSRLANGVLHWRIMVV